MGLPGRKGGPLSAVRPGEKRRRLARMGRNIAPSIRGGKGEGRGRYSLSPLGGKKKKKMPTRKGVETFRWESCPHGARKGGKGMDRHTEGKANSCSKGPGLPGGE